MTVRLLAAYGIYPANAIVTLDAGTETGLIGAKLASATLTGGVVYVPPVLPNQLSNALVIKDAAGNVLGLADANGKHLDGIGAAATLTGTFAIGQTITATLPAGVVGTLQFTRTLVAAPFTKSAIAGAVASAVNSLAYTLVNADGGCTVGVDASNQVSPTVGGVVPAPPAAIRFVTQNNTINTAIQSLAGMDMMYVAGEAYIGSGAVDKIIPRLLGGWYANGTLNTIVNAPNDMTLVGMVLENSARTLTTRVMFSGAQGVTIPVGSVNIPADAIDIKLIEPGMTSLPVGYRFWWKAIYQVPAKGASIVGDASPVVTPTGQRFWRASDDTANTISSIDTPGFFTALTGTIGTGGSNNTVPVIFTGTFVSGDPAVFGCTGDSIPAGVGDLGAVTAFGGGYFRRALRGTGALTAVYAGITMCAGGLKLSTWLSSNKVHQWYQYCNRAVSEMGTNDISNGIISAAQMSALDDQLYTLLSGTYGIAGNKIIKNDLLPNTTGAWTLVDGSDQTPVANWGASGIVQTYRDSLPATLSAGKIAQLVNSTGVRNSADLSKWLTNGTAGYASSDGKHPAAAPVLTQAAATRIAMDAIA